MGDASKITIWHNIVYSAKGGCGKTTFSTLFRAISLPDLNKQGKQVRFDKDDLILLDLDLLASNLGDYEIGNIERTGRNDNDVGLIDYLLSGYKLYDKGFEYHENCKLKISSGQIERDSFMLITSPRTESERGYFKSKRRYLPVVKFDEFKYGLTSLIKKICSAKRTKIERINSSKERTLEEKEKALEEEFKKELNIVYDLPPNSDGFTEIVFDIILNYKSDIRKDEDIEHKVRLFVLSNPSVSILKVNLSWLNNFLSESGSNIIPNQIYFLLSTFLQNPHPYLYKINTSDSRFNKIIRDLERKQVIFAKFEPVASPLSRPISFKQETISQMIQQITSRPPIDTSDDINQDISD